MSEKGKHIMLAIITGLLIGFIALYISIEYKKTKEPQTTIDTSKTDSMQVFYSKQLDSIKVENQLLQVKIEAKTETIRTLKVLVKENNHYFESITDSALFEELKKIRSGGIR